MPKSVQQFLADAVTKKQGELETALLRIPEDKRNWKRADTSRSALDQIAEVAILNGDTADIIINKVWPADYDFAAFGRRKEELSADWPRLKELLDTNTAKNAAAIGAVSDDDLATVVQMPWGPMTIEDIITYPFWNMSYHEGQINYIASLLGCLE